MKRLHVHMGVRDLETAITYYSAMFGAEPVKVKEDYAKWAPEDLAVNFAVSTSCGEEGVGHLGVEVVDNDGLDALNGRLEAVEAPLRLEGDVSCCYAKSRKSWSEDPTGLPWELFNTYGEAEHLDLRLTEAKAD